MAPLLLDRRHVFTVGILFVVSILLCFAAGYILGYQQANKNSTSGSLVSELFIPYAEPVETMSSEEHLNASSEPGENVDVDTPDVEMNEPVQPSKKKQDASVKQTMSQSRAQAKKKSTNTESKNTEKAIVTNLTGIIDTADSENAKYSIQVGLYGIKVNAERKVKKLIGEQLSGHLTNFNNDKGDVLYNVRFGYFLDKASVIAALDIYQKKYTGEGYIIRLGSK